MLERCFILALTLVLSACASMAPRYERPAAPVPASWPTGAAYTPARPANVAAADIPWRQFVKDDNLRKVIDQALLNSRDLRKTLANIESARAQYRIQRADLVPHFTGDLSATKSRSVTALGTTADSPVTTESYTASVGLSAFEIDLFGKQRSLADAALESYLATEAAARATQISLIAETASAYLTFAADNSQLAIARRTLESAQRSMEVTRKRLESGVVSGVDVRQAETVYQQARADVASLNATIAQDRNALELLVGAHVDDGLLPARLPEENTWIAEVPAGVASSVLLARPDVLEAEHNLKAANANIGAARAAFFPSLSLTGNSGVASGELSSLFNGPAHVWSVSPSLSVPIFSGGANRANLAYTKAQRDLFVSDYELTIQTAFKEVADALAVRGTVREQIDAQGALVEAAQASYRLADARYTRGVDTFLNALDSQRTLYSAEQALVTTRLTDLTNLVTLYRVLGGGTEAAAGAR